MPSACRMMSPIQREILTARDAGGFETKCQGETLIAPTETDDTDRAECIDTIGAEAATHVDLWHRVGLVIDSGGRATDSDNYAEIGKGHLERAAPLPEKTAGTEVDGRPVDGQVVTGQ